MMIIYSLPTRFQLFHDGSPYHIETSPLICCANQWTGFCMIGTSVMKELSSYCALGYWSSHVKGQQ